MGEGDNRRGHGMTLGKVVRKEERTRDSYLSRPEMIRTMDAQSEVIMEMEIELQKAQADADALRSRIRDLEITLDVERGNMDCPICGLTGRHTCKESI